MLKVIRAILFIFVLALIVTMHNWGVILSVLMLLTASQLLSFKFNLLPPDRILSFSIAVYMVVALAFLLIWFAAGGDVIVRMARFTNHFRIASSGIDNVFMAVDASKNGSFTSFVETVPFKNVLEQNRWEARLSNFVEKHPYTPALYAYLGVIRLTSNCIIFGWVVFLTTPRGTSDVKAQSYNLSIIGSVLFLLSILVLMFLAGDIGGFERQATFVLHNRRVLPGPIANNMVCHILLVFIAISILPSNKKSEKL